MVTIVHVILPTILYKQDTFPIQSVAPGMFILHFNLRHHLLLLSDVVAEEGVQTLLAPAPLITQR